MATLMWQRDIASDAKGVKTTFSSWDNCMSKTYCKWPVIAVIIFASLIALSLIWCCARCLCCGVECCCGCLSCCNSCCPSPRRRKDHGYQQPPPPPQFQPYPQYASPAPPMYAGGGYRGAPPASTATFDNPTKSPVASARPQYNEDALPPMPSWSHAQDRHIEDHDVEMEKLDHTQQAQQQSLLPKYTSDPYAQQSLYEQSPHPDQAYGGDIGAMHAAPYHNYNAARQATASPSIYSQPTVNYGDSSYALRNQAMSTVSPYEPSVYPPSYHTQAPVQQIGRKPVNGSWRDV